MRTTIYRITALVVLLIPVGCEDTFNRPSSCYLEPKSGTCYAAARRYYYDRVERRCKEFTWRGCDGVVPFNTLAECQAFECTQQ
jgi:hypothetical protein